MAGPLRIFQIGFNKCGTRTLAHFFESNGIPSVHWERGQLARRMFRNLTEGRPLVADYDGIVVFSDMEFVDKRVFLEGYKLFPILFEQYPDALFILNTRSVDAWIKSRLGHGQGRYVERLRRVYGLASTEEVVAEFRADWERHHARVAAFFKDRGRFLKFDIEKDEPQRLVEAIPELTLDLAHYQHQGKTSRKTRRAESSGPAVGV